LCIEVANRVLKNQENEKKLDDEVFKDFAKVDAKFNKNIEKNNRNH
jgi:hypothetical protein